MGFFSKIFGFGKGEETSAAPEKNDGAPVKEQKNRSSETAGHRSRTVSLDDLTGFVEFVAKSLVDYPDEVKVVSESAPNGKMIKIICRPGDRGKIIGKKGKTIMALRALVAGAAGRSQERISVEVPDEVEAVEG